MRRWITFLAPIATAGLVLAGCATPDSAGSPDRKTAPSTTASSSAQTDASAARESGSGSDSQEDSRPAESADATAAPREANADTARSGDHMMGSPGMEDQNRLSEATGELVPVGVRTAQHDGFSRLVIEFAGSGKPGWFAGYTDEPTHQASGQPVKVSGNAYLHLGIEPTPWPGATGNGADGLAPGNFSGAGIIEDVAFTGAFEAQSQFVVGVKEQLPYSVTYLDGPPRVVVDFAQ